MRKSTKILIALGLAVLILTIGYFFYPSPGLNQIQEAVNETEEVIFIPVNDTIYSYFVNSSNQTEENITEEEKVEDLVKEIEDLKKLLEEFNLTMEEIIKDEVEDEVRKQTKEPEPPAEEPEEVNAVCEGAEC